ncbi:MAG: hypothetical protein M3464_00045 [Chloroflexota bacterium]|nr:hypothetical protein [Chloroflexota bacterium]
MPIETTCRRCGTTFAVDRPVVMGAANRGRVYTANARRHRVRINDLAGAFRAPGAHSLVVAQV